VKGLFDRAEALAKQRAEILLWADRATSVNGFGSPRKLRRSARRVEDIIVSLGELALHECRKANALAPLAWHRPKEDSDEGT
jgi:hypothetical protein